MTANIIPFAFEDHLVRTVMKGGAPWFVGVDVCRSLELRNSRDALSRLDQDEKGVATADTLGGPQELVIVSEPGVYRLVFTSRKPEAERFKRWLAHEVLPELRRTGRFAVEDDAVSLGGEPVPVLSLKLAMVREARLLFGLAKARGLWSQLGMPAMPVDLDAMPAIDADAMACLRHLLGARLSGARVADLIDRALSGEEQADDSLIFGFSLRVEKEGPQGEGLWIPHHDQALLALYAETPWANGLWRRALRRLPGALGGRDARVYRVNGVTTRGVFLPEATLAEIGPPA